MKLIALSCRRCGGPLQLPDDVPTVTCLHCGTRLKVVGLGSGAHTETLDALDRRTERIESRVDDLHRHSTVAELDRRWEVERERYYTRYVGFPLGVRPDRSRDRATAVFVIVGGTILAALLTFAMHTERSAPGLVGKLAILLPLAGVLIAAVGTWTGIQAHRRANVYEAAEQQYRRRRAELERDAE